MGVVNFVCPCGTITMTNDKYDGESHDVPSVCDECNKPLAEAAEWWSTKGRSFPARTTDLVFMAQRAGLIDPKDTIKFWWLLRRYNELEGM